MFHVNPRRLSAPHLAALRGVVSASAQAPASFAAVQETAGIGQLALAPLLADLEELALVQHGPSGYSPTITGRRALEGAA